MSTNTMAAYLQKRRFRMILKLPEAVIASANTALDWLAAHPLEAPAQSQTLSSTEKQILMETARHCGADQIASLNDYVIVKTTGVAKCFISDVRGFFNAKLVAHFFSALLDAHRCPVDFIIAPQIEDDHNQHCGLSLECYHVSAQRVLALRDVLATCTPSGGDVTDGNKNAEHDSVRSEDLMSITRRFLG